MSGSQLPPAPQEPKPSDFGLTAERYAVLREKRELVDNSRATLPWLTIPLISPVVILLLAWLSKHDDAVGIWLILGVLMISGLIWEMLEGIENWCREFRFGLRRGARAYEAYLSADMKYRIALDAYQRSVAQYRLAQQREQERLLQEQRRKQHGYWMSLDPYKFEQEIAALFEKRGYRATVTKGSGDGGIDIILERDGRKGVAQCKRFKSKVGPAPIRDLFGVMRAGRYKFGYAVCPSGFTKGAYEFSKKTQIELIDLDGILEMAK